MEKSVSHPRGLYSLFFTELWERFGFYTIQTIIVLYMSHGMGFTDKYAFLLYGTFSSMLYLMPVIGGYLADRFFGFRQSILFGALFLIIGYSLMAVRSQQVFFLGMSFAVLGNGFFKPNVSSMVGTLYGLDDPRRDSGFTIFYMGINLGSLLPPLFAGPLVNHFGWNWGFLIAAFGIVIGGFVFLACRKSLKGRGAVPAISPLHRGRTQKSVAYILLAIGTVVLLGILHILFLYPEETDYILIGVTIAILIAILFFLAKERPEQRRKLLACVILILISIGFWAVYTQTFTSLMLFADRNMAQTWLGLPINAEFMQFFNPLFIILLSPFFSKLWFQLDVKKCNPSTPVKFAYGLLFMAIGFFLLALGVKGFSHDGISSPWWLIASYFFQTVGELLLSPIGLSMVTRLAPHHLVGMMMGVWFLSQSTAFAIGAGLATWSAIPEGATLTVASETYAKAFFYFGLISAILTILAFLLVPLVKRLIANPIEPIKTPKG